MSASPVLPYDFQPGERIEVSYLLSPRAQVEVVVYPAPDSEYSINRSEWVLVREQTEMGEVEYEVLASRCRKIRQS